VDNDCDDDDFFGDNDLSITCTPTWDPDPSYEINEDDSFSPASSSNEENTEYRCTFLEKCESFSSSKELKEHLKSAHNSTMEHLKPTRGKSKRKIRKSFKTRMKCSYFECKKYFTSDYNVSVHIRKHHLGNRKL